MDDINKEEQIIQKRKEKIINFIKSSWIYYILLAILVWIVIRIRTLNLPGLRDVTTNNWTLGPDLDPFLFLRWAKEIVENGSLFLIDTMRYVPLGFNVQEELVLHTYLIAWFHKIAILFGSKSIEQSTVLYPAFIFGLTVIAFFFLVREIFIDDLGKNKSSIIALLSSFFLSVLPSLIPRTVAGIPEKEASGFLFLFLAFFFFITAWKSKTNTPRYIYALFSTVSTIIMALVWGGFIYIYLTISLATLFAFILGQVNKERIIIYSIWLLVSIGSISLLTNRYSFIGFFTSTTTGTSAIVLAIMILDYILEIPRVKQYIDSTKISKLPRQIKPIVIILILFVIFTIISAFIGDNVIISKFDNLYKQLVNPTTDRLGVTVAENRQPYFTEWAGNFGPSLLSFLQFITVNIINFSSSSTQKLSQVPLFFWLFFIGSVYLFFSMIKMFNLKEKVAMTSAYLFFLIAIIFSRYSPNSTFNGGNFISSLLYFAGILCLVFITSLYYYRYYNQGHKDKLSSIDFGLLILFSFFFFSIVSARGAVRLIMVLVPSAAILVSYLFVTSIYKLKNLGKDNKRVIIAVFSILIISSTLFSGYYFYKSSEDIVRGYVPNSYTQQWQYAMFWVRENTTKTAVFGHWWDYGYWLQSIGERATVLDGGNAIPYWNHLMGRHALTGRDNQKALEFLYSHKTTHFLIDSTDIGKYSAFSSIGSDENYDRRSWISSLERDNSQTKEAKNGTIFVYTIGQGQLLPLDEDIIYETNSTQLFLPSSHSALVQILLEQDSSGKIISNPQGIFFNSKTNTLHQIPLKYAFKKEFIEFDSGIEAGIFLMPRIIQEADNRVQIEDDGASLFLSNKTVKSQLARLYLYKEENPNFVLVHTEDDPLIKQIKTIDPKISDIAHFGGFRGPIRIWEIKYPKNITLKEEYISKTFPNKILSGLS